MSSLQSLLVMVTLLSLPGSLGLRFGGREDSRSSEIHLPFLNIGLGSSHEQQGQQNRPSVSDDLNPEYFCQGPCKDGWITYLGYCHIYVSRELSWKDAEGYCQSLFSRSHLTSVQSEKHNQFLMILAQSQGYRGDKLWTGGNKERGSNTWADGSPFSFLKLPRGNLRGVFGGNKCISLNLGGGSFWNDLRCTETLHFICTYKPRVILRSYKFLRCVAEALKFKWLKKSPEETKGLLEDLLPSLACAAVSLNNFLSLQVFLTKIDLNRADYYRRTPIHIAASQGTVDMLKFLLSWGANHSAQDKFGITPLHDAIRSWNFDAIRVLRSHSARVAVSPTRIGMEMCVAVNSGDKDGVFAWYLSGVDMDQGDYDNRTPMHIAVCNGDVSMVEILLRFGATPLVKDNWGNTPIQEALRYRFTNIYKLFHPHFTEQVTTKEEYLRRRSEEIPGDKYMLETLPIM